MIEAKVFSAIFGSMIGSFLNALIYRIPIKKSIAEGRSRCPQCNKTILWYENLPIISYLFLRGKCSKCGWKIPISYLLVEMIMAAFAYFITPNNLEYLSLVRYAFNMVVCSCFVIIFVIDVRHKIIPNKINIILAFVFLAAVITTKSYFSWVVGGLIGVLFPLAVTYVFYLVKGQIGLGGGDIKLWGALGIYLGPEGIIQNISYSCFLGALLVGILMMMKMVNKNTPVPFGPFIVIVSFIQIFTPGLILEFSEWLIRLV